MQSSTPVAIAARLQSAEVAAKYFEKMEDPNRRVPEELLNWVLSFERFLTQD